MAGELAGRHALVGGASRGIGRAIAESLAAKGATITGLARSQSGLAEVIASLDTDEGQAHGFVAVDFDRADELLDRVGPRISAQPVHILINNTGGPPEGPAHGADAGDYLDAFNRHLVCGHRLLQACLPGMRATGWGRVINIISTSVKQPIPNLGVSNTVRGAVANWAKTLAGELGPDGITVNNVLPGFTDTDRLRELIAARAERTGHAAEDIADGMRRGVPVRRFAKPAETAAAVAFLASRAADYITGINLPVDGGRTGSL